MLVTWINEKGEQANEKTYVRAGQLALIEVGDFSVHGQFYKGNSVKKSIDEEYRSQG